MLVLSRLEGESIIVPDLDLAFRILRIAGGRIRVGIEAPENIRILRSELVERGEDAVLEQPTALARHELRNRLNSAGLALTIAEKHLERGDTTRAEIALQDALSRFASEIGRPPRESVSPTSSAVSVLLVEDNRNESRLLAEVLSLSGIDVRVAGNGLEALKELNNRIPVVVLLDMFMPDCDGPTTIKKIRSNRRFDRIALYAVTGAAAEEMDVPQGEMGIRRWFQKPVQSAELVQAIRNECTTSQLCC